MFITWYKVLIPFELRGWGVHDVRYEVESSRQKLRRGIHFSFKKCLCFSLHCPAVICLVASVIIESSILMLCAFPIPEQQALTCAFFCLFYLYSEHPVGWDVAAMCSRGECVWAWCFNFCVPICIQSHILKYLPADICNDWNLHQELSLYCKDRITELQNGWGWKGSLEICLFQPTLLKQDHIDPVAQDYVQTAFEYLQERTAQPLWATRATVQSPSQWRKCFLMFRWKHLHFSLCLLPLVLSLCTAEMSLALSSLHCLFSLFVYIDKIPLEVSLV